MESFQQRLAASEQERDALAQEAASAQESAVRLRQQLTGCEQDKKALIEEAASVQASAGAIGQQLSVFEGEKKSLIQEAAQMQATCNALAEKFALLGDRYRASAEESALKEHCMEQQLQAALGEVAELKQAANAMQAAAEKDAATLAENELEVARLSTEVARLSKEVARLSDEMQAAAERDAVTLAGKDEEISGLTAEVARLSDAMQTVAERDAIILAGNEQENSRLLAENARLSDDLHTSADCHVAAMAAKEQEITRLSTELQTATDRLAGTREECIRQSAQLQSATDSLADTREKCNRLSTQLQTATDSLADTRAEIARLSIELRAAKDSLAANGEEISGLSSALKDAASSHAAVLAAREQDIARLLGALNEATEAHDEAVESITAQGRKDNSQAIKHNIVLQDDWDRCRQQAEAACSREHIAQVQILPMAQTGDHQFFPVHVHSANANLRSTGVYQYRNEALKFAEASLCSLQEALTAAVKRLMERAETAAVAEAQLAQLHTEKRLADVRADDLAERLVHALNTEGHPADGQPVSHVARMAMPAVGATVRSEDDTAGCKVTAAGTGDGDRADSPVRADSSVHTETGPKQGDYAAHNGYAPELSLEQLAAENDPWAELLSDGDSPTHNGAMCDQLQPGNGGRGWDSQRRHKCSSPEQKADALHADDESAPGSRGVEFSAMQKEALVEELGQMQMRLAVAEVAAEKLVATEAAAEKLEEDGRAKDEQLAELRAQVERLVADGAALREALEREQVMTPASAVMVNAAWCPSYGHCFKQSYSATNTMNVR